MEPTPITSPRSSDIGPRPDPQSWRHLRPQRQVNRADRTDHLHSPPDHPRWSRRPLRRRGAPISDLDQIPNLGDIFAHNDKSTARTELIIFIRPQIIRDGADAHYVAEELRSKLRGTIKTTAEGTPHVQRLQ